MKAYEFINEKIDISVEYNQKIMDLVTKWSLWMREKYDPSEISSMRFDYTVSRAINNQLGKYLNPMMNKIVRQNINKKIQLDPDYEGHKLKLQIDILPYSTEKGSVRQRWSKLYTKKPKYIFFNVLDLSVRPEEMRNIIEGNKSNIASFSAVIAHELTHVVQSVRSEQQGAYTKPYTKHVSSDKDVRYLIQKIESESFAEEVAFKIIALAMTQNDPKSYIKQLILPLLMRGVSSIFSRAAFPNTEYEEIKTVLKKESESSAIEYAKNMAWKRFNKKLYEKLMNFLNK